VVAGGGGGGKGKSKGKRGWQPRGGAAGGTAGAPSRPVRTSPWVPSSATTRGHPKALLRSSRATTPGIPGSLVLLLGGL